MIELMIAAPGSGSGKTVMTCALLTVLKRRGLLPCAFKCGPDYIDPMFHRAVLGVKSHNLDLFLSDQETMKQLYAQNAAGHGSVVCEGAMGFYDGVGGSTDKASAWQVADALHLPVLLTVRPKGASLTLAAQINGLKNFRKESHLRGILLNDCSPMLYESLAPMLEKETGLPVLGFLPHMPQAELESRHLGLYTAGEIDDLCTRLDVLADMAEQTISIDRLLTVCRTDRLAQRPAAEKRAPKAAFAAGKVRLAVAQDEAFCFRYAETLESFEQAGAELVFFSPLRDAALPAGVSGLYLPGGYPELHAEQLSQNVSMRKSIYEAISHKMPTVAECGGFLYLGQTLTDMNGRCLPQAGVLPGNAQKKEKLVRFGYSVLTAETDSLLFRAKEQFPAHEFHYWDSDQNGTALIAQKPVSGRSWRCGFVSESLYAAFPHLYFAGNPKLTQRFVATARQYQKETENEYENGK